MFNWRLFAIAFAINWASFIVIKGWYRILDQIWDILKISQQTQTIIDWSIGIAAVAGIATWIYHEYKVAPLVK